MASFNPYNNPMEADIIILLILQMSKLRQTVNARARIQMQAKWLQNKRKKRFR